MKPTVPAPAPERLALLTPAMAELCRRIGEDALLALIGAHGGTRLYIPEAVDIDGPLVKLVGEAAAAHLVKAYGREYLLVPLCKRWQAHMLAMTGLSAKAIARQLGMHWVSIERILSNRVRADRATSQLRFDV